MILDIQPFVNNSLVRQAFWDWRLEADRVWLSIVRMWLIARSVV